MSLKKLIALAAVLGTAATIHVAHRQRKVAKARSEYRESATLMRQPYIEESIEVRSYAAVLGATTALARPLSEGEIRRMINGDIATQVLRAGEQDRLNDKTAERNQRQQLDSWRELPGAS